MAYNFNITIYPWGNSPDFGTVVIDEAEMYGAWEYKDGTEGGGLWFERLDDGRLDVVDYDGAFSLPMSVIKALREANISLDETFD